MNNPELIRTILASLLYIYIPIAFLHTFVTCVKGEFMVDGEPQDVDFFGQSDVYPAHAEA